MKNKLSLFLYTYIYFTICHTFSQVSVDLGSNIGINDEKMVILTTDGSIEDDILLYGPVKFTPTGLRCFFNHKFNNIKYSQDYLPHNLSDLVDFLQYAKETNQSKSFIRSVLKMFNQKFKAVEFISARQFTNFLKKLPELIEYSLVERSLRDSQVKIKDILYSEFLNKYRAFKENPDRFFSNISEKIYNSIISKNEIDQGNEIPAEELRSILVRIIEFGASKLVWFLEDTPDIWAQFKETANSIYNLRDRRIINDIDDINDIIHSALSRFLFIIDIRGSSIEPEFYKKTFDDIVDNPQIWLEIEELDEFITPKKELLKTALKNAHVKAVARHQYGIISNKNG